MDFAGDKASRRNTLAGKALVIALCADTPKACFPSLRGKPTLAAQFPPCTLGGLALIPASTERV